MVTTACLLKRTDFIAWHKEQIRQNKVFDMKAEIEKYCHSDVCILRKACRKFRSLMLEVTGDRIEELDPNTNNVVYRYVNGIDPFAYITIASVCQAIFLYLFLEEDWTVLLQTESDEAEKEGREPQWVPGKCKDRAKFFFFFLIDSEWVEEKRVKSL